MDDQEVKGNYPNKKIMKLCPISDHELVCRLGIP